MAAFMKAKLQQTKISSEVKTGQSASGAAKQNFANSSRPVQKPPAPSGGATVLKQPAAKKYKQEDNEDFNMEELRAAAEAMAKPREW